MDGLTTASGSRSDLVGAGTSPVERVEEAIARAREADGLGAFWSLDSEGARAQAERLLAMAEGGLAFAGEPVAVKDLLDVKGLATTAGIPGEHPSAPADAEAVRRLRSAGAIPIGKTAMDQLGCTTGGQSPGFPPCLNPVGRHLSPGGSSSGSAVAVAAGITSLAIGTDTAGSVRIPAAYTGIVGFKPARTAIPRRGCLRVMPGFDTVGLLASSVELCLKGYAVLTGRSPGSRALADEAGGGRIGVLTDLFEEADGQVGANCELVLNELERSGFRLEPVELGWRAPGLGVALAWELATNWGPRVDAEPDRYTEVIRDTIAFGRAKGRSAHDSVLAEIKRAQVRFRRRCSRIAAVVCPTVPVAAPDLHLEQTAVSTRFTRIFNALGWPAFSLPAGTDPEGRPIGIQAAAPPAAALALIEVARRIEVAAGQVSPPPEAGRRFVAPAS